MNDNPTLSVGFAIAFGDSFAELARLNGVIDQTTANALREFAQMERASKQMVDTSGAQARMRTFGVAATRDLNTVTQASIRAERAAESMVRQIERQIEVYGKSASEIRTMRAEMRAAAAEEHGLTEWAEKLRTVNAEMRRLESANDNVGGSSRLASHHMLNLTHQANDLGVQLFAAAQSSDPLRMAFVAIIQQGAQVRAVMDQAGLSIRAVAAAYGQMARAAIVAAATNPILLTITAALAAAASAIKLLQIEANKSANMKEYAKSLGLTAKEIRSLDGVTVTYGDTIKAVFQVAGREIWSHIGGAVTSAWNTMKEWAEWIGTGAKMAINFLIASHVAAFQIIKKTWSDWPEVLGDLFISGVNRAIEAINALLRGSVSGLNWLITQANNVLPEAAQLPLLTATQIDTMDNKFAGAAAKFGKTARDEFQKALGKDYLGDWGESIVNAVSAQAILNAQKRIKEQAEKEGFLDPTDKKTKLTDEEKATLAAIKAAEQYIAAQEKEAAAVGKTAKEIRLLADAAARAAAPTEELKRQIDAAAAARENAYTKQAALDFDTNVLQPLRDELALYGLVGPARAAAALELEKQAFLARNMDDGIEVATARWQEYYRIKRELIDKDAAAQQEADNLKKLNEEFDRLIDAANRAGDAIAAAFGRGGAAISDAISVVTEFSRRQQQLKNEVRLETKSQAEADAVSRENAIAGFGELTGAAKQYFREGSAGYAAMAVAEKTFAVIQAASTIKALALGAARMFAALGPFAFPAIAAMTAVMAGFGVFSGSSDTTVPDNRGTGTVFGDSKAQSESIKRSIDQLKSVDTVMLGYSRQMAASLQSIENSIGGFAAVLVRNGDSINASANVVEGFKNNALGALLGGIPLIGGLLNGLFGTRTDVIGSGISGNAQSLGGILGGGFEAQYYSDVQKTRKFLGIVTGRSKYTEYAAADPALENQFTLLLKQFNDAIVAAGPALGESLTSVQSRLNGFVVNLGKIELSGLTGEQIEERLNAVFGAAADNMANAAFPFIQQFQKVGEGAFETLVRVSSTIEAVGGTLDLLGQSAQGMGIAAKLGLVDQFDSLSALTNAADSYFKAFYTQEEQAAAKTAQMGKAFQSLGLTMPDTLAAFRQLVEAQDLTSTAGQATYATLLQLAPAFADLKASLEGVKSAADVASERQDLQRQLLELRGDTAAIRALELAKLDASNRALQEQVWAVQDAQKAADAAEQLRQAWSSVGDGIEAEIDRIRGLSGANAGGNFASLLGQFNAANAAARLGDMDAAKSLPGLSQALLNVASESARSQQELARVQAQTAAALEATKSAIAALGGTTAQSDAALIAASATTQAATSATNDNGTTDLRAALAGLKAEVAQLREENNAGNAAIASKVERGSKVLENVAAASGGDALATVTVAA